MAIDVYLNFNGNCREAVEYYFRSFRYRKATNYDFWRSTIRP